MSNPELRLELRGAGIEFAVIAAPGSPRPGVKGVLGGSLKVALGSAPERGKANEELRDLLADLLGVRRSEVSVVRGLKSRRKQVRVEGATEARVRAALGGT